MLYSGIFLKSFVESCQHYNDGLGQITRPFFFTTKLISIDWSTTLIQFILNKQPIFSGGLYLQNLYLAWFRGDCRPLNIQRQVTDTHNTSQTSDEAVGGWKGLRLKLRQGLESAGQFYTELVSKVGDAVGVADGEPIWNGYLGQWQVWVNFADGCRSVGCDWVECVG
ncbi:hypothetical protein A6770_41200 [Nostoc minutum NIES-26]|uniref:Uncharacterized protein n=1 Tax=Nostoc minutum NIES-26 TaxID=1844469 RepID=A0A367RAM1_9NOSO|nr:hypothetical protein A6770_41200 [Nostoc minutum NIES-26]